MRKAVLFSTIVCCLTSIGISQTMIVEPLGLSPRDVELGRIDTTFNRAYNGLLNVGVGTQMYFMGTFADSVLSEAASWAVVTTPVESGATLGTPVVVDTATEAVEFTPDLEGIYKIAFVEGAFGDTITFHAGTYVGGVLEATELAKTSFAGTPCQTCHQNQFTEWMGTGHYALFEEGMKGIASTHYGSDCISCHTTGYDTSAVNNGFDEHGFVFPDSTALTDQFGSPDSSGHLFPAVWDSLFVFYPDAMVFARIQCESCHGPGSEHMGDASDNKIAVTMDPSVCAHCHDSGTHHLFPEQFDVSPHAEVPSYPGGTRTNCKGCHNGLQFIQYAKGEEITSQPYTPITCAVCHDPHSDANEHQLRLTEATLSNGEVVMGGGTGKLCMNCHQSRQDADSYTEGPQDHFGPHYVPQADMLIGTNVVTFGRKLPSSAHFAALENSCADCHMSEGHVDDEDNVILTGSHSFRMVTVTETDTLYNTRACEECHGDVGETFAEKMFFWDGHADHDGDGVEEGLQEEVHGLMEHLGTLLPSDDPHAEVDETWTRTELKAAYNHRMVYYDHSYGVHNPAFTVALLRTTIEALEAEYIPGAIVAIEDVPNDQGNQVRIIWEKFNGFEPVDFYVVNRMDDWGADGDTTWTAVGMLQAYEANRFALVVPTVYNEATTFEVVATFWDETEMRSAPGQGTSVDNLVPTAPTSPQIIAEAGVVTLSWGAPADPIRDTDINFYRIYRATTQGFTPSEANEIATTTDLAFVDPVTNPGDYYYKIAAEDFNGNLGEYSIELSAHITGIEDADLPMEYALAQNYPNPFNPSTTIKFQLKEAGHVNLVIYDQVGREVLSLVDRPMSAGYHSVTVGADKLASGIYFYRIRANEFTATRKMLILK